MRPESAALRLADHATSPSASQGGEPSPSKPLLVTAPDAARQLAISERALWSMTSPRGPIPVVRIGRAVRYAVEDLRRYVESHRC